jgi:hypothetical protein
VYSGFKRDRIAGKSLGLAIPGRYEVPGLSRRSYWERILGARRGGLPDMEVPKVIKPIAVESSEVIRFP